MHNRYSTLVVGLCAVGLMSASDAWAAQAGRVQFVNGDVQIINPTGQSRPAQKGDAINEGDTLISASAASAQIKMQDGGFIAVRPDTRMKFDQFVFAGKEDGSEKSFFSLFKGGFRAVTGLIGQLNKQNYKIATPAATIGIRGTDHETVMVLQDNPLVLSGGAAPGAYNKVNVGETSITTDRGSINVLPNQMGFAGGLNQMPQIQPINANLFTVAPQPSSGAKMDNSKGGDRGARATAVVDNTAEAKGGGNNTNTSQTPGPGGGGGVLQTVSPPPVVVVPTNSLTIPPVIPAIPVVAFNNVSPNTTNLNWLSIEYGPGIGGSHNATDFTFAPSVMTYDAQGIKTATVNGGVFFDRQLAQNLEGGADAGVVAWGRWANGTVLYGGWGSNTYAIDQGSHMFVGIPVVTYPQMDAVAFNFLAATRPTEARTPTSGNVWQVTGGKLTANFLTNNLSASLNLTLNGSNTYLMNVTGATAVNSANAISGTVAFQGGAQNVCGTGCATNGTVVFAGQAATHAGMGYEFSQTNGTFVQGLAVFKR